MIKKVNISDIDLTDLEQSLLIEFIDHLDQFEPGYSDLSGNEVADFVEGGIRIGRGVLGSLVKKGILMVDEWDPHNDSIVYLIPEYYGLCPNHVGIEDY